MARSRPIINSFNAGELSPLLDGRVDQDKYFSGAKTLSNFIPTVQGPARRRGGTRHVGNVKFNGKRTWLAKYQFSVQQAYILEWGHNYLRFYVNRGLLLQLPGPPDPYELVTPYAESDLITAEGTFALRLRSSGDVTWIVHAEGKFPPYRLSRVGATYWVLEPELFGGGPFKDTNVNKIGAVQASDVVGTVTVTVAPYSPAIFSPLHVGSLFMIEDANPALTPPYQASATYAVGAVIRNSGNFYEAFNYPGGVYSGTTRYPPTHTEGDSFDGAIGWRYLHSGYGWGKILSVTSDGRSVQMAVISRLPSAVTTAPTYRWAFSEFSYLYGYPVDVDFFKERLTYARGRTVFSSVVGDFNNFARRDAGLVTKESAIVLTLAGANESIRWMSASKALILGSASAETALQEQTSQTVFAADNAQNVPQTDYGGRLLRPLRVGESVLFVERAGHRIRDMRFSFDIDRYKAEDLTVLSEHIFDGSEIEGEADRGPREIIDWAYQQQRDSLVWCVLSDGSLACLVFNRERGVIGWTPHYLGGDAFVEAVQSIPSPDGRSDDVWFVVRRTVDGLVQRSVEYLTDYRLVKNGADEAVHVDNSVTYRGAPTTVVTGLDHLNSKSVDICVDGSNHPPRVVSNGQITLQVPGSLIHVGYGYTSRYQSMRLEIQGGGGTSQTARKALSKVFLRFQSTIGGRFGPTFAQMDPIKTLNPSVPYGTPPELFTGDIEVDWPNGWELDGYICYEQTYPLPATLVAIVTRAQVND